jgi:hypothetical protein
MQVLVSIHEPTFPFETRDGRENDNVGCENRASETWEELLQIDMDILINGLEICGLFRFVNQ